MSRRDTILISVFVNAGLLVVLFVVAIMFHNEPEMGAMPEIAAAPALSLLEAEANALAGEESFVKLDEEKKEIVYKLPPIDAKEAAAPALATAAARIEESEAFDQVVTKKGDSLDKLAKKYKTTVARLQNINNLKNTFLRVNQTLKIPRALKEIAAPKVEDPTAYYIVRSGDNPWTIAIKHHLKVEELLRLNNLNEESARRLRSGDRLRIR